MDCRTWQLVAVGLALLCGGCAGLPGMVPVAPAAPMGTAGQSSVTDHAVATPVPTASEDRSCPLTEPSPSAYCDKEVLLASRDALRGTDTDALRTWQRHNPLETFAGVRVDPSSGRVVAVEVQSKSLGGFIPPELGQLRQLQVLDLGGNRLRGPIPPELGRLDHLQVLDLTDNLLTGPIPSELGLLDYLQALDLGGNRLRGPIPPELGQLGQLQKLSLNINLLTGSIPPELGRLDHLQVLNVSSNLLTGPIPAALGQLGQLQELNLGYNIQLTGTIPAALGQLGQLQVLDLSNIQLTGIIPATLGRLGHLQVLDLRHNRLTGTIPSALGQLGQLGWLSLDHNRLTGTIPSALGQLGHLEQLSLAHNRLTGAIPSALGRLGHLQVLDLRHNRLTCAIPSALGQLGHLEQLSLDHNRLTGTIPPVLGQLGRLGWLSLDHNRLTGPVPPELGHLRQLQELNLPDNQLSGTTSPEAGQRNQLGIPPAVGAYTSQTDHWAGRYRVLRQGRQVTATLAVHRSPVGHGAPPQPLFRLPEGYRPVLPVTWATTARPVTAQGRPRTEAPAVTVLLEVRPDGTVHHVDAPTLDGTGYVGYHTVMVWTTDEAALLMAGTFATGEGTYRLMRLGDTVTATLAFPVAAGSAAGLSAHLFTVPAGFRPVREATWTVSATAWVSASGSKSSGAVGPSFDLQAHRDGKVVHVAPPRPAGYVATVTWRTADPGWMEVRGAYAPSRGDGTGRYNLRRDGERVTATVTGEHGVPDTSVLFTVPAGFRPERTVRQAGVLDAAGCHVLTLKVRPEGTVHLVEGPDGIGEEPLVHRTTLTWTAGADVCQRHPRVQAFLLRILGRDSCAEVTWTDLASVDSLDLGSGAFPAATLDAWLEGVSPQQAHDLADPDLRLPPDFLAHVPGLESLTLEVPAGRTRLSADLLVHVPGLRSLTLKSEGLRELPPDFLAAVPGLEYLFLEVSGLKELPLDFLAHTPGLESLILKSEGLTELPSDFLAHTPRLWDVTLETPNVTVMPVDTQVD